MGSAQATEAVRFGGQWETKRLGEVAIVIMGQSPPSASYNAVGDGLPLIQGNADLVRRTTIDRIWTTLPSKRCGVGDIVLTVRAPVGSVARASKLACLGRGVCGLKPLGHGPFLYYALILRESHWKDVEQGSTFSAANSAQVAGFTVALPMDKLEQRAIAAVLSDVDDLIGSLEALIAKKRAIKQAAMQELLTGRKRLPGFEGEWETRLLRDLADCLDHVRVPLNEAQRRQMPGPYPYCGANGVVDHIADYVLDDDVILIAEDGGHFEEHAYRPIAYRMTGKIWVNNHAHVLKAKPGFSQAFLFFALVHKDILPFLASGTRSKLNRGEMNKIAVCLPRSAAEQRAIAAILSDMDTEIAALERRLDKTRAIKQGVMQQLLTGSIRLPIPATSVEGEADP